MLLPFLFSVTLLGSASTQQLRGSSVDRILQRWCEGIDETLMQTEANIQTGLEQVGEQLTAVQKQLASVLSKYEGCPNNWHHLGNDCYVLSLQEVSWILAARSCAELDRRARLASVHPANKDHVASLLANSSTDTWIGLYRLPGDISGNSWGWSDGTLLDFTNWGPGEPNNLDEAENCVNVGIGDGRWYDIDCGNILSYICQITL